MCVCVCLTESLCYSPETNTTLRNNYTSIEKGKKKSPDTRQKLNLTTQHGISPSPRGRARGKEASRDPPHAARSICLQAMRTLTPEAVCRVCSLDAGGEGG